MLQVAPSKIKGFAAATGFAKEAVSGAHLCMPAFSSQFCCLMSPAFLLGSPGDLKDMCFCM